MGYLYEACDLISDFCHQFGWSIHDKNFFFMCIRIPRWPPPQSIVCCRNIICIKSFFSETRKNIELPHCVYNRYMLLIIPALPEGGGGYTVLPLSVLPSVQDIFRCIFLQEVGIRWVQKRFQRYGVPI
jgi:hypothetical protein